MITGKSLGKDRRQVAAGSPDVSSATFSFRVREEISGIMPEKKCCREALLAAVLFSGFYRPAPDAAVTTGTEEITIETVVPSSRIARLLYRLVKEISGRSVKWEAKREPAFQKRHVYHIFISLTESMKDYINRWGITVKLRSNNLRKTCCQRAFLAGAFLASGSISSPDKRYHFEIVEKDTTISEVLVKIMARMKVVAKITKRRGKNVIYVKKADGIANLINILGAHRSLLKYEEIRAIKQTKEEVRRRVNAETANLDKTARMAARQIQQIKLLIEKGIVEKLSKPLQDTVNLRMRYPQANLKELGERFSPPVPKSTVNNRLRRLERIFLSFKS